jgi:hypothetical protein
MSVCGGKVKSLKPAADFGLGGLGKLDLEANPRKIATRRLKCAVKHKQEGIAQMELAVLV